MTDENKRAFIDELALALVMYSRIPIAGIGYKVTDAGIELAEIHYANGSVKYADITGDSCIAIMKDIAKALI